MVELAAQPPVQVRASLRPEGTQKAVTPQRSTRSWLVGGHKQDLIALQEQSWPTTAAGHHAPSRGRLVPDDYDGGVSCSIGVRSAHGAGRYSSRNRAEGHHEPIPALRLVLEDCVGGSSRSTRRVILICALTHILALTPKPGSDKHRSRTTILAHADRRWSSPSRLRQ